ncbi:Lsr2 family DNA-binding protein [Streptomyces chattanoogensis]
MNQEAPDHDEPSEDELATTDCNDFITAGTREDIRSYKLHKTPPRRSSTVEPCPADSVTGPPFATVLNSNDIRDWAWRNGYRLPPHGRIPGTIREAYDEAHCSP